MEMLRFLVGGGANTAFSLAVYWLLLAPLGYPAAYTIGFVAGIVSGFAINTFFVFRTRWSWRKLFAFPLVHAVNYACGLFVVWVSVQWLGVDARAAPVIAIAVTLPLNFLLSRRLIRGRTAD